MSVSEAKLLAAAGCVLCRRDEIASRETDNYVIYPNVGDLFLQARRQRCNNTGLQLKKSKRITVRHFYSEVPMSVVSSPKATSQESSQGAPKVFR